MPKEESPLSGLNAFIPEGCFPEVVSYLRQYKVHLTVTRERKSILGNYRNSIPGRNHRISVNGNLNKYAFLITLLHELAHLLAYEKYGNSILPHGRQWKHEYTTILSSFLARKIFPADIEKAILLNLEDPAASNCADVPLTRVLRKYDNGKKAMVFVEEISEGGLFKLKDGKIFSRGEKVKKRFKCREVATGKMYLFSPVYEVEAIGEV